MLKSLKNTGAAGLQNSALVGVNVLVAGTVIGLTALTLIKHFDDSPEVKTLSCAIGIERADCADTLADIQRMRDEHDALTNALEDASQKLDNLSAIERNVDEVTLFQTHTEHGTGQLVTVGTVYRRLVEPQPDPDYFCYIQLQSDNSHERRNLETRSRSRDVNITRAHLERVGVAQSTLDFARSVCRPLLIHEAS